VDTCENCETYEVAEGHLLCWECAEDEALDHGWRLDDAMDPWDYAGPPGTETY
jgi:hypothetical protein